MTYTVVFTREKDGRYSVSVPALEGCFTEGDSFPDAVLMAEEVIALFLESLRDRGRPIPDDVKSFTLALGNATEARVYRIALRDKAASA